ncbi:hypothetical protein [Actinoalloteichus fjordicus]|uniref:Uncharacterized protein n=1 Tax=Actinoalloteichus fjordicus TaxID=1612552 RepID=A0AAC9LCS3_9PSEU|nr:hypothetical protein [Actinoalloteichus fjordicus]APU15222.1 hypothetical protein UA74_15850 [Actinoalloteichus fjordicus]
MFTSVWANLDILFSRQADALRHVIETDPALTGVIPDDYTTRRKLGYGVVSYELDYAESRRNKSWLVDQPMLSPHALRAR